MRYFFLHKPDFITMVEHYNTIGYHHLLYPLHVSRVKQRQHSILASHQQLQLCALHLGVFSNVINLDKYNLFLLGICFWSLEVLLYQIFVDHIVAFHISVCLMAAIKDIPFCRLKKPPDKNRLNAESTACGFIACSSTIPNDLEDMSEIHSESFDSEEQVIIGLDSMCSRHLFIDKSDFVSDIKPIVPFDIHGVGGNIEAIGQGTVRLRFRCSSGTLHDKLLFNAYYAPNAPVRLISVPQLGRDTGETSTLCTSGCKSIFTWNNVAMTLQHSTPSGVPFLRAYVGNPTRQALYNVCFLAHNCSNPVDDGSNVQDLSPLDPMLPDINEHIDGSIDHIRSLLRHPIQSDKQREYTNWHHKLGHLSHAHLQELVKLGKLPQRYRSCTPPVCPAFLFAKQTKRKWRHKGGGSHSLRGLAKPEPGSLTFADQMVSSTPGLIPQSTGSLTKHHYCAATIFVDSFSDYTHVSLQEDLTMDSTLDAKLDYERKLSTFGVTTSGYHADNGRFAEAACKESCQALHQKIQFCGVGSHHQNGIVERRIRDLSDAARASLLHAIHHWPEGVSKNLRPFALKHACNVRNRVRSSNGTTPEELLSRAPSSFTSDLSQYHPFGCPAYVLDARLQGGSKIP